MDEKVNSQITDAVTQTNTTVVGGSSAQSMGMIYQSMAHSMSLLMQNSVAAQGGMQQLNTAIIASSCQQLMNQRPTIVMPQQLPSNVNNSPEKTPEQPTTNELEEKEELELNKLNEDVNKRILEEGNEAIKRANEAATKASAFSLESNRKVQEADESVAHDEDPQKNEAANKIAEYANEAANAAKNASDERSKTEENALLATQIKDFQLALKYLGKAEAAAEKAQEYQEQAQRLAQSAQDELEKMQDSLPQPQ